MIKGFRDFILRGNVVDLAVGIVIGAAFGALVNSFVANLIMSPIGAIFGKPSFDALTLGPFKYGAFLTVLVQFLIIATAIYFAVVMPANHVMKRLGMAKEPPKMRDCPACLQSIPAEATKCMYCTTDLPPQA
jgi:large conductance mechanosensitive channel